MQIQVYRGIPYAKNHEIIQDIFDSIRLVYRGIFCKKNNSSTLYKNNFVMCYRGTSYKKS